MEIVLKRYHHRPWGIDGDLYLNGVKFCNTVENPSCHLGEGRYELTLRTHPFRRGDGALAYKKGEIVVGDKALAGMVIHSKMVYERLYDRLKKEWQRKHDVWLCIE